MKKTLLSILLIFITLITHSQIRISGYVIDAFSKTAINKAIVTLDGANNTLITNEKGYFTVVLKETGLYDFSVSKNGYKSLSENLFLNESIEIQITLTPNEGTAPATLNSKTITEKKTNYLENNEFENSKEVNAKKKEANRVANQKKLDEQLASKTVKKDLVTKTKKSKKNTKAKAKKNKTQIKKELYYLTGSIRDKFTKQTLSNATISFLEMKKTYSTTNDGLFKIEVPSGNYTMFVNIEGYYPEKATIPVNNNLDFTILLSKDTITSIVSEEIVISGTRVSNNTPTTFTKITKEQLKENNLGKDLPYLLELTPSFVASSDGGSGVGYTSMRIRGSDMSRINFTLNGFPVNDSESQGVFLVNTPDLTSDMEDIQIQRGIGTSTNGAGAFGASVNINTNKKHTKPYAEINNSYGSFNTMKNTIKAGTGTLYNHFSFDGRFSHVMTDGFIDRSSAKLFGYALTAAYFNKKSTIRFNLFSGKEVTHQAWNGVNYNQSINNRTFNSAGTDYGQKAVPHNNEIDNYKQDNYQLAFSHKFSKKLSANLGFHYTKGKGYFEQYKVDEDLLDYGVINPTDMTDLIRRRWLDNDFYGTIFSVNYKMKNIDATLGGGWNQYDGDHYGEIIWAKNANDIDINEYYYTNNGLKTEFNTFLKAEWTTLKSKRLVLFGDIQYRKINYTALGNDNDQVLISENAEYNFINPKFGATVLLGKKKKSQLYASFAMANREPTRNDFIDNADTPEHETMIDLELGYRHKIDKMNIGINSFYMTYKNQLVLTGELNDVGSAVRSNVANSFRTGVEVDVAYEFSKFFGFTTTAAWSLNEIEEFSLINYLGDTIIHDKTKIAYSPTIVGNITLYTKPFKGFKLAVINKYVSEQFLDNTNNNNKKLDPYFLMDARVSYSIQPKFMNEIEFIFKVNNIFNTKYSTNGYVYYDTPYFYPQAGTNLEGGINLKF